MAMKNEKELRVKKAKRKALKASYVVLAAQVAKAYCPILESLLPPAANDMCYKVAPLEALAVCVASADSMSDESAWLCYRPTGEAETAMRASIDAFTRLLDDAGPADEIEEEVSFNFKVLVQGTASTGERRFARNAPGEMILALLITLTGDSPILMNEWFPPVLLRIAHRKEEKGSYDLAA